MEKDYIAIWKDQEKYPDYLPFVEEMVAKIQALTKQKEILINALEFYADTDNCWTKDRILRQGRYIYMPKTRLSLSGYEVAREALKQVEEIK